MNADSPLLVLDPARALGLELPRLDGIVRRMTLRGLLALSGGAVSIEGARRLAGAPRPAIFALTHHNAWEAVLAPAALIALRDGRRVRFLVDWMFVDLPWTGWLVRQIDPIRVDSKRALFGLRAPRRRSARRAPAFDGALAALAAGDDVGFYPEGRRNRDPWRLGDGRRGVACLALRSGVPVVPVGVDFPARDRILRTPRAGRFVLRVGEPLDFAGEHARWLEAGDETARRDVERDRAGAVLDRVQRELARLSRKVYVAPPRARPGVPAPLVRCEPSRRLAVERVDDATRRQAALGVVAEVYQSEKGWIPEAATEIPADPGADAGVTWLLARFGDEPVGVVRITYDPPLALPTEAGVELEPGIDLDRLARAGRFAEVGRLMIRPEWRARPKIVLALMRGVAAAVIERGVTHLLTAVFEDDPHSPYRFHTRQLGFERIGTHRHGELACASRRILLVLDIARSLDRLAARGTSIAKELGRGLGDRLAGPSDGGVAAT